MLLSIASLSFPMSSASFTDTTSNAGNSMGAVTCFKCDVEITDMTNFPFPIAIGGSYEIDVTVVNHGSGSVPVDVTLEDTSNAVLIGSQTVTLTPGESRVVTFTWNPENLVNLLVTLRAEADSPRDPDPSNNWKEEAVLLEV